MAAQYGRLIGEHSLGVTKYDEARELKYNYKQSLMKLKPDVGASLI